MKKAMAAMALCLLLLLSACSGVQHSGVQEAVSPFAGGSGTEADPYRIASVEQLQALAVDTNSGTENGYAEMYFLLEADLDLSDVEWTPIGSMEDMDGYTTAFQGNFDGGGHTIFNLTYRTDNDVIGAGLFGVSVGSIHNLTLENVVVEVTGKSAMAIGGIIGYNMGPVDHLTVRHVTVSGNNCTGGIIGGNGLTSVTNCVAEDVHVTVIGDNDFTDGLVQVDVAECGGLIIGGAFGGTIDNCTAQGSVQAFGNEPVGLGGVGGCLEMMDSVTNCTADVVIETAKGGHAVGGLCGYAGTHSDPNVILESEGYTITNYPGLIENCSVTVQISAPGATHVGGLVGTGLYYYGEETAFALSHCSVAGKIDGAITPGIVAGRALGSTITDCTANVLVDGVLSDAQIGSTERMYESADQYTEEEAAEQLLSGIAGTYQELFPVLCREEYRQIWLDNCAAIVGTENAETTADMLIASVTGTLTGEEAVSAYADGNGVFCCGFLQDVNRVTFDGSTISGTDANGQELFRHEYRFVHLDEDSGLYVFESADLDSGEFQYFCLAPDTPAETYHAEFRYGSDLDALGQYDAGTYAYWMVGAIPVNFDQAMVEDCIALFCTENLSE